MVTTMPLAEIVAGLFKTEVIRRRGPWHSIRIVEFAILEWVWWSNHHHLMGPIGQVPPVEYEKAYYHGAEARPEPSQTRVTTSPLNPGRFMVLPALAGNGASVLRSIYPRSRGESCSGSAAGLSPFSRGILLESCGRSIPALAGNGATVLRSNSPVPRPNLSRILAAWKSCSVPSWAGRIADTNSARNSLLQRVR